jgi:hypothetical protein
VQDTVVRLLNPQTPLEDRYTKWLCEWDNETLETIAAMLMRLRFTGDPTVIPIFSSDRRNEE